MNANKLRLTDPLESLRSSFQEIWKLHLKGESEASESLLENLLLNEIPIFLNTYPRYTIDDLEKILFEEKLRIEDRAAIVEDISKLEPTFEKNSSTSTEQVSAKQALETQPQAFEYKESFSKENAPLDLAAMIDTMLEEER